VTTSRTEAGGVGARDGHPGRRDGTEGGSLGCAEGTGAAPAAKGGFRVIKDETFTTRSMKVEDAVMHMNLLGDELLVFTDSSHGCISVLYRRKDGNYGLIETGVVREPVPERTTGRRRRCR